VPNSGGGRDFEKVDRGGVGEKGGERGPLLLGYNCAGCALAGE